MCSGDDQKKREIFEGMCEVVRKKKGSEDGIERWRWNAVISRGLCVEDILSLIK